MIGIWTIQWTKKVIDAPNQSHGSVCEDKYAPGVFRYENTYLV